MIATGRPLSTASPSVHAASREDDDDGTDPQATPDPQAWLLASIPLPNEAVRSERRPDGLKLSVPLRDRWWMRRPWSWLLNVRRQRGFLLDRLGEEVWSACDGKCAVADIIETFAARHQLRFHEARVCVTTFLRSLVERRIIVLTQPTSSARSRVPMDGASKIGGDA